MAFYGVPTTDTPTIQALRCIRMTGENFQNRKRLFSLNEAALYLGRSVWSIRRLIWSGELPSVRAGGRVHVDLQDMVEFIERNKEREDF